MLKGYNDSRTTHPEIAREWNKERNGDPKPTDVIASSNKRVWRKCKEGHEWSGLIANRARKGKADPGCPYCSGRKVLAGYNDLVATHPDIAPMWHPRMNKRLKPIGVQVISRKLVWWRGECGHVYQMAVRDGVRAKPGCCPVLLGGEEAREADKARLALGPRRGRNGGRRRCLLPIGVILRILDWAAMRGGYEGLHRLKTPAGWAGAPATCGRVEFKNETKAFG